MANYCKDCGAQFGNNIERNRCVCGGAFNDEPTESRPGRLLDRLSDHSWARQLSNAQVTETGSGTVRVTLEFDDPDR